MMWKYIDKEDLLDPQDQLLHDDNINFQYYNNERNFMKRC